MKKFLIILILMLIILYACFKKLGIPGKTINTGKEPDNVVSVNVSEFIPYEGTVKIIPDFNTSLDGLTLEEIANLRIQKVEQYKILNFFPPDYHPLKHPHSSIYNRITGGKNWLKPVPFYIVNPYILIILSRAKHVTPLNYYCSNFSIVYTYGKIVETHRGTNARCWFEKVFNSPDFPGRIRIWMVNAYDAGFHYINLDFHECVNVEKESNPHNIMNTVYSNVSFYHVGRYGVNNISAEDRNAWIKLCMKDMFTRITLKLWREKPASIDAKPDIIYEIQVTPY